MGECSTNFHFADHFQPLHLTDEKKIQNFLGQKHLKGSKKFRNLCSVAGHRILHFIRRGVWINEKKCINLAMQKKKQYEQQIKAQGTQGIGPAWEKIRIEIPAYLKIFERANVKSKIAKILNSSQEFLFSNTDKEFKQFLNVISKDSAKLSFDELNKIPALWKKFSPHCLEPRSKQRLTKIILSYLMTNKHQVKQNFAFMHAEDSLSSDSCLNKYEGGEKQLAGSYFLHFLLQSQDDPNIQHIFEDAIERYQQWALKYESQKHIHSEKIKLVEQEVAEHLERISKLQVGETYLLLTNWYAGESQIFAHALAYLIIKEPGGTFTLIAVNTGKIADQFHETWIDPLSKKKKINPFYTIRKIPAENLSPDILRRWVMMTWRMKILANFSEVYKCEFPLLQGERVPLPLTSQDYITPQRSGSCVWSFYMAVLRNLKGFKPYKETVFRMKVKSIIHFYELFKADLAHDLEAQKLLKISIQEYEKRITKSVYKEHASLISLQEQEMLKKITDVVKTFK